jgi:transcriptional accessory protein Tex/SPT6
MENNIHNIQKRTIFENKGIEAILKTGKELIGMAFIVQYVNAILQNICSEVVHELSKSYSELVCLEEKLFDIQKFISEIK